MSDILPLLNQLQPELSKTTCRQLAQIVVALLSMTGRITQRGLSRWTGKGGSYRTIHRFFHTEINWLAVKWRFFELFCYDPQAVYLLAGDESVVTKSGKKTYGVDRFFSSLFDKAVPSIAGFSLALIHTGHRRAYSLCTEQVVRTEAEKQEAKRRKQANKQGKKPSKKSASAPDPSEPKRLAGRPKGSKNKNKADLSLNPELTRIQKQVQKGLGLVQKKLNLTYLVLDGHFGNRYGVAMVRQLGLHLVSKLRSDAALFLEPTQEQKQKSPRLKYGDRLVYEALPQKGLCWEVTEGGYCTQVYQAPCWHKDFAERLNVVMVVRTHLVSGRRGHVVLFSTDLSLSADLLIDYYALRFQIEFTFRDAKQYFGLEDWMGVSQTAVANGMGLSLFLGNLSGFLLDGFRKQHPRAGILDLKSYYRGRHYLEALLKWLPDLPEGISYERLLEELSQLGSIHGRSGGAVDLEMAA